MSAAASARVLVTTPSPSRPGGVAQYLRALRPHLGDNVQYLTIGSRRDRESLLESAQRLMDDSWTFASALRNRAYDVVHLNPSLVPKALIRDGLLLMVAKLSGKPVVVFLHGWDDSFWRNLSARWKRIFRGVYGMADAFIVLGQRFKQQLQIAGCHEPVFVQAAPIDDELFSAAQQQPAEPYKNGPFRVLFLARLEKEKGICEAIDAFRLLSAKYPQARFTIAGEGHGRALAERHASGLSGIEFIGHVQGRAKYEAYRQSHAYLFPSYFEGLPISVLEAMAFGLPLVTTPVGGLPDFFLDRAMGYMTQSRDPQELFSALEQLIQHDGACSRINLFNRVYAREHFTSRRLAATLERVYGFVLEGAH